jgi:hypothetical protein
MIEKKARPVSDRPGLLVLRTPLRKIAVRLSLRDHRRIFLDSAAGTT